MPDCPARHIPKSSIMNITNRCFDHSLRFADLLPQNMIHTYRYRKPDACQQPQKPASQPGQETASPVLVFTSGIRALLFFYVSLPACTIPVFSRYSLLNMAVSSSSSSPSAPNHSVFSFSAVPALLPPKFSAFSTTIFFIFPEFFILGTVSMPTHFYLYIFRIFSPIFSIIYCSF